MTFCAPWKHAIRETTTTTTSQRNGHDSVRCLIRANAAKAMRASRLTAPSWHRVRCGSGGTGSVAALLSTPDVLSLPPTAERGPGHGIRLIQVADRPLAARHRNSTHGDRCTGRSVGCVADDSRSTQTVSLDLQQGAGCDIK